VVALVDVALAVVVPELDESVDVPDVLEPAGVVEEEVVDEVEVVAVVVVVDIVDVGVAVVVLLIEKPGVTLMLGVSRV